MNLSMDFSNQVNWAARTATTGVDRSNDIADIAKDKAVSSGTSVRMMESKNFLALVSARPALAAAANLTFEERNDHLQSVSEKLSASSYKFRGNTVLFDVYAILQLMQDSAQKLRNAQREQRLAAVQAVVSSIFAQADLQRTAALTQMVVGLATAAISAGFTAVQVRGTMMQSSQSAAGQKASGLNYLKNEQTVAMGEGNKGLINSNVDKMGKALPAAEKSQLDAAFSQPGAKPNKITNQCRNDFAMATKQANNELFTTGKVSPETQAKVDLAGQRMNYASAKELQMTDGTPKSRIGGERWRSMEGQIKKVEESTGASGGAQQMKMQRLIAVSQFSQMAVQMGSALSGGISGIFSAKSTAKQAEQKRAEELLSQFQDLFSNIQSLVQQTIQVFSQIVQKESQSVEEINRGLC